MGKRRSKTRKAGKVFYWLEVGKASSYCFISMLDPLVGDGSSPLALLGPYKFMLLIFTEQFMGFKEGNRRDLLSGAALSNAPSSCFSSSLCASCK